MPLGQELIKNAKSEIDLTDDKVQDHIISIVTKILASDVDLNQEFNSLVRDRSLPLELRVALHLAKSKRYVGRIKKTLDIAIVYAVWGEHNRIKPRSSANPNGEDSLRTKIKQLNWLFTGSPIEWSLYVVDDGCPYGSGEIARNIIANHPVKSKVKVLFLKEALPTTSGPLGNLPSADASRKGGAIIYGATKALEDGCNALIYTDADNSVHLGQVGLLLEHYIEHNFKAVLGNRKDPSAVLVKQENRWGIGIKLLRHMQRMVGRAIFSLGILDSQAAFKLYDANLLKQIIVNPAVYDFSFDSDWIAASIMQGEHFAKVPFAFIDSFAESASVVQGPMTTWETLLLGLVKVVERRGLPHNTAMAKVLKEEIKSSADLELLINVLPPELTGVDDEDLGHPEIMSPGQIEEWIKKQKQLINK